MEFVSGFLFPVSKWVDFSLLLLRLTVAVVFLSSGWSDIIDLEVRSKSIGMGKFFTLFLGLAEISGALGIALGVLIQFAAGGLILVMLGAIRKKIFDWQTGFWGKGNQGWHYDLLFISMNLVILTTDGGKYILWK
jgi:putative oxidoreductase